MISSLWRRLMANRDLYYKAVLAIADSTFAKSFPKHMINDREVIKAKRYLAIRSKIESLEKRGASTALLKNRLDRGLF